MPVADYLILVQNLFLILVVVCPAWILCKGKKKAPTNKSKMGSNEPVPTKSSPKVPSADVAQSQKSAVKEETKKDEAVESKAEGESKEGDKKEGGGSGDAAKESSLKPFPKFEMPTESKKNKKLAENEKDKKEKMKNGFYQEKSDEDDTLEKVDSLHVEQSEKTKRSQKNKNKKKK
ncbi:hypothetical protein B9Z55_010595 [Caenorhabditis nigoni]|uniref:Uncharacterized protein n=1 Tax=Caenorhabditis nigoni TaxID=1611254 RepID=A0A2G5UHE3_9PELO|nr:hypothetical protein B9Z55_010595 [Caenorhabditis nigoni]